MSANNSGVFPRNQWIIHFTLSCIVNNKLADVNCAAQKPTNLWELKGWNKLYIKVSYKWLIKFYFLSCCLLQNNDNCKTWYEHDPLHPKTNGFNFIEFCLMKIKSSPRLPPWISPSTLNFLINFIRKVISL